MKSLFFCLVFVFNLYGTDNDVVDDLMDVRLSSTEHVNLENPLVEEEVVRRKSCWECVRDFFFPVL